MFAPQTSLHFSKLSYAPAPIYSLDKFQRLNRQELGTIVVASGGFDPLHDVHTDYLLAARELGDTLVVLVNDDRYLERKKGYRVLSQDQRCRLIANLRPVTIVIPHTMVSDKDTTVNDALRRIRPNIFAKGTDIQDINQVPENQVMTELGGCVRVGVGNTTGAQTHSSDLVARVLKKLQK